MNDWLFKLRDKLDDLGNRLHLFRLDIQILGCNLRISFLKYQLGRLDSAKIMWDLRLTTLYLEGLHHE